MLGAGAGKSIAQPQAESQPAVPQETHPLTPDTVAEQWRLLLDSKRKDIPPRLLHTLSEVQVVLDGNMIVLQTEHAYLEMEMKPYKVDLLEWLRHYSGQSELNCRVEYQAKAVAPVIYSAEDKYESMLRSNPSLAELRKMLVHIDL